MPPPKGGPPHPTHSVHPWYPTHPLHVGHSDNAGHVWQPTVTSSHRSHCLLVNNLLHEIGREVTTWSLSLVLEMSLAWLGGWVWGGVCRDVGGPAPDWGFWSQCFDFYKGR